MAWKYVNPGRRGRVGVDEILPYINIEFDKLTDVLRLLRKHRVGYRVEFGVSRRAYGGLEGQTHRIHIVRGNARALDDLIVSSGVMTGSISRLTRLHAAGYLGKIEEVKRLLAAGVGIDEEDCDGLTVLHWMALGDDGTPARRELAALLVAEGADVNAKTKGGFTVLGIALDGNVSRSSPLIDELKTLGAAE